MEVHVMSQDCDDYFRSKLGRQNEISSLHFCLNKISDISSVRGAGYDLVRSSLLG